MGIDAIHLADHAIAGEPMHQRDVVGMSLRLQAVEQVEIRRIALPDASAHLIPAGRHQPESKGCGAIQLVVKRAALASFGVFADARTPVFDGRLPLGAVTTPEKRTAFPDGVQRVDHSHRGRKRKPCRH